MLEYLSVYCFCEDSGLESLVLLKPVALHPAPQPSILNPAPSGH